MPDMTVDVLSAGSTKSSTVTLPEAIFGRPVNVPLIHQVVVAQQAAARQGTHDTKTRGEVRGGGAKPWRQKGTGRARQGSRRAPQWTGGGTVFGPHPRSYAQRTPKKMIAAALWSALSDRVADSKLFVMDSIGSAETPSTRDALAALSAIGDYRNATVVLHRDEDVAWLSLRNVPHIHAIAVDQLNVYDVVVNEVIVFTKAALDEYLDRWGFADDETAEAVEDVAETLEEAPKSSAKAAKKAAKAAESEATEAEAEAAQPDEATATDAKKGKK